MELVGTATGRVLIPVLTGTAVVHAACGLATALGLLLATGAPLLSSVDRAPGG